MRPFKKKTKVEKAPVKFDSIICIPGNWASDQEVKLALVQATMPNQTFSPTTDSPIFRITEEPNPPYQDEEILGNPPGMWRLTKE